MVSMAGSAMASTSYHVPPMNLELDGVSIANVLTKGARSPSRTLIHHCREEIHALRFIYDTAVYKLHLAGYKWHPGSTHCGKEIYCSCFDVEDYSQEPV
ncbi:hypothetical protein GWK47_050978 [Chionoecetes opilio]|uniref:Uncharacterized protein n=1 Tax=Chionoecetes opilio TaxID=41210 RepID=A0A8J4Y162_CHIOP|nr:hypothetical protein GWK47_050978 [Chionoecetes opilio]